MAQHTSTPMYGASDYDLGLRKFFLSVFFAMGIGLAITGVVAWWISHDPTMMNSLFHLETAIEEGKSVNRPVMSATWIVCSLFELGMVFFLASRVSTLSKSMGYGVFMAYAVLSGVTLAPVLYAYTDASVGMVFFIAAAMFAGSALFGLTTKIDLKPLSTFFLMALIGLIVAMLLNFLFQSAVMDYAISVIGVVLFAALTAFDMQKLEALYDENGATDGLVIYGGLTLYLDFINMFLFLLRLFGTRRS